MMGVRIHSVLTPEQRKGLDAIAKRHEAERNRHTSSTQDSIFHTSWSSRCSEDSFVAAASLVVFASGAAFAQTPAVGCGAHRRSRSSRPSSAIRRPRSGAPAQRAGRRRARPSVPLTLEDAVRRAIDNNLDMAVERLNPQTFDFTLASLRANYKPIATSQLRPPRQRAPADEPAEPRQPERLDDDVQRGHPAEHARGAAATMRSTFNNNKVVSPTDQLAHVQSAVQQLVPLQLHAAAAARVPHRSDAPADADDASSTATTRS